MLTGTNLSDGDPRHYATLPLIAWLLGRACFEDLHYVFVSEAFYPHRLPNPKSSSPLSIFIDLYQPALDRDPFDKSIKQYRLSLANGVALRVTSDANLQVALIDVCERIDPALFWPVVLMVEPKALKRGLKVASAHYGSREALITDLSGHEFSMLVFDSDRLPLGREIMARAVAGRYDGSSGTRRFLREIRTCLTG